MNRRRRSSLDRELTLLDTNLQTLRRRELEFQTLMDNIRKMKEEVSLEVNSLEEKKADLEAQKEPINWLPAELLVQIFLAFVDAEPGDTTYRPPVVISHVCAKWRSISLHTSALWSHIILQGFRQPEIAKTLLLRSGTTPLAVTYRNSHLILPTDECRHMIDFVQICEPNFKRVKELTLKANNAAPLKYILPVIDNHLNSFPSLQRLELVIQIANPSFSEAPILLRNRDTSKAPSKTSTAPSPLHYLKLQQFPLNTFSSSFISSLRTLDLTLPPRKTLGGHYDYYLKMSALRTFLSSTPKLEELFLINTVPYFDVSLTPTVTNVATQVELVELPQLKAIEWSYPFPGDVYRFLSFLDAPALEKLDIWIEDYPANRRETQFLRGYPFTSSTPAERGIITYPCLRDLIVQCSNEDSITETLRKYSFPALETLSVANVDEVTRKPFTTEPLTLPTFPRLESLFRDPRLPNLTHLTISHFTIPQEQGKAEAVLGYMPVLISLSLDSCSGVGRLMEVLQEKLVGIIIPSHTRARARAATGPAIDGDAQRAHPRRGVKVCPKLESMSFWGCHDMTFQALCAVVLSRNRSTLQTDDEEDLSGSVQNHLQVPNGDGGRTQITTQGLSGQDRKGPTDHEALEPQMGRKIKPLRKLRYHAHGKTTSPLSSSTSSGTSSATLCNVMSTVIPAPMSLEPADIIFLRISNCRMINEGEAMSLRDLGVVGVIWAGSQ